MTTTTVSFGPLMHPLRAFANKHLHAFFCIALKTRREPNENIWKTNSFSFGESPLRTLWKSWVMPLPLHFHYLSNIVSLISSLYLCYLSLFLRWLCWGSDHALNYAYGIPNTAVSCWMSRAPRCSCDTKNWEYISISFLFIRFTTKSILRTSVFCLRNHLLDSKNYFTVLIYFFLIYFPNLSGTWGNVSKWLQNIPFLESPRLWSGQPSPETPWPAKWKNSQKERRIESVAQDPNQSPSCLPHSLQDLSLALATASPIFKTGIINLFF